jgi:ATP-dependent protease ClpP protease subunit
MLGGLSAAALAEPAPAPPTKSSRSAVPNIPPRDPKAQQGLTDEQRSAVTPVVAGYRYNQAAKVWVSPDQTMIYLVGEIEEDSFKDFAKVLLAAPKVRTVYLASPGGIVLSSYWIGALIRDRKLDTWVEHECVSSCTQIFAAGARRLLGQNARLGFHQTYSENSLTGATTGTDYSDKADLDVLLSQTSKYKGPNAADQMMVTSLRWAGVSDSFLTTVMRTPPEKTWNPSAAELISAGMATGPASAAPGLALPPDAASLAAVEESLQRQRFWQVLKRRVPARYDTALLDVWRESNGGVAPDDAARNALVTALIAVRPRLAGAPDAALERLLPLLAANGLRQRFTAYPDCGGQPPLRANLNAAGRQRALQAVADAAADLLDRAPPAPPLTSAAALKLLDKDPDLRRIDGVDFAVVGGAARGGCNMIYLHDEAVQQLTGARRLRLARAWLAVDLLEE